MEVIIIVIVVFVDGREVYRWRRGERVLEVCFCKVYGIF